LQGEADGMRAKKINIQIPRFLLDIYLAGEADGMQAKK